MKDFEEFRLETFNSILPLVKEVVDTLKKQEISLKAKANYLHELAELKKENEVLKDLSTCKKKLSEVTYNELKKLSEETEKQIQDKEALIKRINEEVEDCIGFLNKSTCYLKGVAVSLFYKRRKDEVLLKSAEDVKMEYLREYFYLMFLLEPIPVVPVLAQRPDYIGFTTENLLEKEAVEYICKFLVENEEEDIASRKIKILTDTKSLSNEELWELFK